MALTKEEKAALEVEIAASKQHCHEAWQTLLQLNAIAKSYLQIHDHWRKRFEKADRKLAEEERLTVCKGKKPEMKKVLTKEQILAIAAELDREK